MTRQSSSGCQCRVPTDQVAMPQFSTADELAEWCRAHDVEILPDHQNRPSVAIDVAYRLRAEANEWSEQYHRAEQQARLEHERAVADLRAALAAAFLAETGGAAVMSEDGRLVSVPERKDGTVIAGLAAARAVWHSAPFAVASEVTSIEVQEGDTLVSYDMNVVLPRQTVESGIASAVRRANRAAAI